MGSEKKTLVFSLRPEEEIFSQRLYEFLTFQMDEQPREGVAPALNVIKTLIFGVKPSRQLAEAAPRETPPAHEPGWRVCFPGRDEVVFCSG